MHIDSSACTKARMWRMLDVPKVCPSYGTDVHTPRMITSNGQKIWKIWTEGVVAQ